MELSREAKIFRFVFKSIEIENKLKSESGKINFSVNGIHFTTVGKFASERELLDDFLHCEKIKCTHTFTQTMRDVEEVKSYLVWTESDGDVMVVACS